MKHFFSLALILLATFTSVSSRLIPNSRLSSDSVRVYEHQPIRSSSHSSPRRWTRASTAASVAQKNNKQIDSSLLRIKGGSSSILSPSSLSPLMELLKKSISHFPAISLSSTKFLLQISLTLFNIACWAIPLRNRSFFLSNSDTLSLANAFAAGVFLMLAFNHMLPEALDKWSESLLALSSTADASTVASATTATAASAAAAADTMASATGASKWAYKATASLLRSLPPTFPLIICIMGYMTILLLDKVAFSSNGEASGEAPLSSLLSPSSTIVSASTTVSAHSAFNNNNNKTDGTSSSGSLNSFSDDSIGNRDGNLAEDKDKLSPQAGVVLLLAMSLHSLLETIALGMAKDTPSAVLMALSIASHQPAESLSLLLSLLKTSLPISVLSSWMTVFSFVGPLGVFVGILIQRLSSPVVEAVVLALTAGSFLYMGATEILPEQFEGAPGVTQRWSRYIAACSGLIVMFAINSFTANLEAGVTA